MGLPLSLRPLYSPRRLVAVSARQHPVRRWLRPCLDRHLRAVLPPPLQMKVACLLAGTLECVLRQSPRASPARSVRTRRFGSGSRARHSAAPAHCQQQRQRNRHPASSLQERRLPPIEAVAALLPATARGGPSERAIGAATCCASAADPQCEKLKDLPDLGDWTMTRREDGGRYRKAAPRAQHAATRPPAWHPVVVVRT